MRDTWPLFVFISLERKDDRCKTGAYKVGNCNLLFLEYSKSHVGVWIEGNSNEIALHFTFVEEMRDTWPLLVFISLQRKIYLYI